MFCLVAVNLALYPPSKVWSFGVGNPSISMSHLKSAQSHIITTFVYILIY